MYATLLSGGVWAKAHAFETFFFKYVTQVGDLMHSSSIVKQLQCKWGLKSTCQQKHTFESIMASIAEIHHQFPTCGAENIHKNLWQEYGMCILQYDLYIIFYEFVINS